MSVSRPTTLSEALERPISLLRSGREIVHAKNSSVTGNNSAACDNVNKSVNSGKGVARDDYDGKAAEGDQVEIWRDKLKDPREWFYPQSTDSRNRKASKDGSRDGSDLSDYELATVDSESEEDDDDMTIFNIRDRDSIGTTLESVRTSFGNDTGNWEMADNEMQKEHVVGQSAMKCEDSSEQNGSIPNDDIDGNETAAMLGDASGLADEAPLAVSNAVANRVKNGTCADLATDVAVLRSAPRSGASARRRSSLLRKSTESCHSGQSRRLSAAATTEGPHVFDYPSDDMPEVEGVSTRDARFDPDVPSDMHSRRPSLVADKSDPEARTRGQKKRRSSVSFAKTTTDIPPATSWNRDSGEMEDVVDPIDDKENRTSMENGISEGVRSEKINTQDAPLAALDNDSDGDDLSFVGDADDDEYPSPPHHGVLGADRNESSKQFESLRIDSTVRQGMALSVSPCQEPGNLTYRFNEEASPTKTRKRKRVTRNKGPTKKKSKREFKEINVEDAAVDYYNTPGKLQENGQPVRRSTRNRFAPLKFWKNETYVYERRKSQIMPTIRAVVEVPETPSPASCTPLKKFDRRRFEVSRITPPALPPPESPSAYQRMSDISPATPTPDNQRRKRLRPKYSLAFSSTNTMTPIISPINR